MTLQHTELSTINEENESEISTHTNSQSEHLSEDRDDESTTTTDSEEQSKKTMSMQSKTFSIDSDDSSYMCFKEIIMSSSSIFMNPFYFFPDPEDPGIEDALKAGPEKTSDDACQKYRDMCKDLQIFPISKVCKSLNARELNLKYYVPFEKQMKALCKTLENNYVIQELNLEDNWLSVDSCTYLAKVLELNRTIKILKMKECRIGSEGMAALAEAMGASSIQELDLSFNSLGNDGLRGAIYALGGNVNLTKLNLSHNELTEESAPYLMEILMESYRLEELNLSWNSFNTPAAIRKICKGLIESTAIRSLNLSWNGIATEETVTPFVKYLRRRKNVLQFLDLSNNLLKGDPLRLLMKGIYDNRSLQHVKIGNNIFSPSQAFSCAEILANSRGKPLKLLDMENMVVQKRFLNLLQKIREQGKNVIHGAVLTDYEIHGPCIPKVLFGRCRFLGMKPKKKKRRVDFSHFVFSLPDKPITPEEFSGLLISKKLDRLLDSDLITALQNQYIIKRTQKINCSQLVDDYRVLYPDAQPEPPRKKKPKKENKRKKTKKEIREEVLIQPDQQELVTPTEEMQDIQDESQDEPTPVTEEKSLTKQPSVKLTESLEMIRATSIQNEVVMKGSRTSAESALSKGSLKREGPSAMKQSRHVSYLETRQPDTEEEEKPVIADINGLNEDRNEKHSLTASGVFILDGNTGRNAH